MTKTQPMFANDLKEFEYTEVPIRFLQNKDGFPIAYINVLVNGIKLDMPIDTGNGWGGILLSPSTLSDFDVQYTGKSLENYDAFGKRCDSKQFILPSVQIGSLTLKHVTGYELFTRWDTPAFMGLPLLRFFNVLIDYPHHIFGLYNQNTLPKFLTSPGWLKAKLTPPNTGLVLSVKLNDCVETFHLCLDTGAAYINEEHEIYNILYSNTPLGEFIRQKGAVESASDPEVLGRIKLMQFRTVDDVTLPPVDFVMVSTDFLKVDGLLSHRFFDDNSVFIDFVTGEIYILPRQR